MKRTVKNTEMKNKEVVVANQKEQDPYDIKIDIQKILGFDKKVEPNPKANGQLPGIGTVVKMYERKYLVRVKNPTDVELGEYRIKRITNCLVECEKLSKSRVTYSTSFKVSDFRAGLILFEEVKETQKALA